MTDLREWLGEHEREWRERLRSVSLVAELEVDDDDIERAERAVQAQLSRNSAQAVGRHNPAVLVVALTHCGMRSWEEGTFYAKVAESLGVTKQKAEEATHAYGAALDTLGLPRFEGVGWAWVTPVLLHGAIPLDHLDELLDVIAQRRRGDPSITGDTFVEWARLNPNALMTQPKALTRFLEHGGDFAPDYVGRVLDLLDGADVVLPRRSLERLNTLIAEGRGRAATRRLREARPTVALLPDGSVVLALPSVAPTAGRQVEWRVAMGDDLLEREATVPWQAGRTTTDPVVVDIPGPLREIKISRDGSETGLPFVRSEDPLLVFNGDGELVPPGRTVPPGRSVVLWPESLGGSRPTRADGSALVGQKRDTPYGWERWNMLVADLDAGDALRLGSGPAHRVAGKDRAQIIVAEPIAHVSTLDGREVVASVPVVELPVGAHPPDWTVTVTDTSGAAISTTVAENRRIELFADRLEPVVGEWTVAVCGPLGRGTTRRVAVIESGVVSIEPNRRVLLPGGGLTPGKVSVTRSGVTLAEAMLSATEVSTHVIVGSLTVRVEPPHVAMSLVADGQPGVWTSYPISLSLAELANSRLRIRGLRGEARMHFVGAERSQEVRADGVRRTHAEFTLGRFVDTARAEGAGSFILASDDGRVPVASVRPDRLATRIDVVGRDIEVDAVTTAPIEIACHRLGRPWEPGTVIPVVAGRAQLPLALTTSGPLRVAVRLTDEWAPAPADEMPRRQSGDVVDLDFPWEPEPGDEMVRVSAALLRTAPPPGSPITSTTLARAFDVLGSTHDLTPAAARTLRYLISSEPADSIRALRHATTTTSEITLALIDSELVSRPVSALAVGRDDVVSLLSRTPLGALLGAARDLRDGGDEALRQLMVDELGSSLIELWDGRVDDAPVGRFEPEYEERPELVEQQYNFLDPVPGVMLDWQTRIAGAYDLWRSRRLLAPVAGSAMSTLTAAERVLEPCVPGVWKGLVVPRVSRGGVIALPALSIAHALVARAAARTGNVAATRFCEQTRDTYSALARRAPGLVAIDLVRADGAVLGALA